MTLPLRSPQGSTTDSLPLTRNAFLGRTREMDAFLDLLRRSDLTCLTITGPGGVGKTRLATQAALKLATDPQVPFEDGIWFVSLAAIDDPSRAPAAIAAALDLDPELDAEAGLIAYLAERHALVILDNVEQVIDIAGFVARAAAACPDLKIVLTSRRPLRVSGEQEFPLSPLPLPVSTGSTEELLRSESVALFFDRAAKVTPNIKPDELTLPIVAQICERLDGLPLAIELASARTRALSPAALLAQLSNRLRILTGGPRDAPIRHQRLFDTVAWSYDLLDPEMQEAFRSLCVFTAGFALDDAERFLALRAPNAATTALERISHLVDQSLVVPSPHATDIPRWSMLETIREFGLQTLAECGELESAQRAHAETVAILTSDIEVALRGPLQGWWLRRLTDEVANIRTALDWSISSGNKSIATRINRGLWRFWFLRGLSAEGREYAARTLALDGDVPLSDIAACHRTAGSLCEDIGEYEEAEAHHQAALEIWRELDDQLGIARALDDLGNVAHDQGQLVKAYELHAEALRIGEAMGDARTAMSALANLGAVAFYQGDFSTAAERWEAAIDHAALTDPHGQAIMSSNGGVARMHLGDLTVANEMIEKALNISRTIGYRKGEADALVNLGDVAGKRGDHEAEKRHLANATAIYRDLGDRKGLMIVAFNVANQAIKDEDFPRALSALRESLEHADRINNNGSIADIADSIALIATKLGRLSDAATLLSGASNIRSSLGGAALPAVEAMRLDLLTLLDEELSSEDRTAAVSTGSALTPRAVGVLARSLSLEYQDLLENQGRSSGGTSATEPSGGVSSGPRRRLTPREIDVLRQLADGRTDREIAELLFISRKTAGTHVTNILNKLEVDNRAAAVAVALRSGYI